MGKGGAIHGLKRAQKEGLIRFISITGHTRPEVISKALDMYPFASILVPVSPLDVHIGDFMKETIPKANKMGVAVVGMKALRGMERAVGNHLEPDPLLKYAWSLPISTLIVGLRRESEVPHNLKLAYGFKKLQAEKLRAMESQYAHHADTSHLWWKQK